MEDHKKRTSAKTLEMVKNGTHPAQKEITCDFCGHIGKGPGFYLKHNDRCKLNPNRIQLNCPYCDKKDLHHQHINDGTATIAKQGSTTSLRT